MRVLVIGDIHGRDTWKRALTIPCDKIVFIGDYCDSFDKSDDEISSNLANIIFAATNDPEKFILLLGNHDIQYLLYPQHRCSGFRSEMALKLQELFRSYKSLFKVAYQINDTVFTHAGISQQWWKWFNEKKRYELEGTTIAEQLNNVFYYTSDRELLLTSGMIRGNTTPYGGIFWADMSETVNTPLEKIHQIVGHTPVDGITEFEHIIYCDCLGNVDNFLLLEFTEHGKHISVV